MKFVTVTINVRNVVLEHGVGVRQRPAHVFLGEPLGLDVQRSSGLSSKSSAKSITKRIRVSANQLLGKRDLLQLHLVHSGLRRAQQRSCCDQGALHLDRLLRQGTDNLRSSKNKSNSRSTCLK
jgi:hypothetical protein